MKRQRGRNRNKGGNNNNPNRSFDSNGPEVKVRGNAQTVYERYMQLARDAQSAGNRVRAENLMQHAEHYLRLNAELQAAHQAAKEEREARRNKEREERQARGESDDDQGSRNRNRRRNRRDDDRDDKREDTRAEQAEPKDEKAEASGLETITPETDDKPTRRRRAPSRKKDAEPEAAE